MKYLDQDIRKADWLDQTQKDKLCKAFATIRMKDILIQGLDMLDLDPDVIWGYRDTMIGLLRALTVKEVSENLGSDRVKKMSADLEKLFTCFDIWECEDMRYLTRIYNAYNYPTGKDVNLEIDAIMRARNLN